MPDFARYAVETEIRARADTQDNNAAVEVGRSEGLVLNENNVDRDAHSAEAPLSRAQEKRNLA